MHLGGVRYGRTLACLLTVSGLAAALPSARASELSPTILRVSVSNFLGDGYVEIAQVEGLWDADRTRFEFARNDPIEVVSEATGETIAYILNLSFTARIGPLNEISLGMGVYTLGYETDFRVESSILDFRSIPASTARGRASATFAVTDLGGDFARLTGLGPSGAGACRAMYNGRYPAGRQFAQLISFVYATAGGTTTGTQNDPPTGYRLIGAVPSDLSIYMGFRVTPDDIAYAVSRFVIPSPNSWCTGDVDADENVDLVDLALVLSAFGGVDGDGRYVLEADFDQNGVVNLVDLSTLLAHYGAPCP